LRISSTRRYGCSVVKAAALTQPYSQPWDKAPANLIRLRPVDEFLAAGDSYLAFESIGKLIAVESFVAGDDDPCDLQGIVFALLGISWVLLEKSVVEMYFSRTTFDDDVVAVCHVNLSFEAKLGWD
jgi:hypothetical protein